MSSTGNGQPKPYEVSLSDQLRSTIKNLHQQAAQRNEGQQFLDSLRKIYSRLQSDPQQFGELLYRLPVLKLFVYHAAITPIVVVYAVHQEQPLVFLQGVKLLS